MTTLLNNFGFGTRKQVEVEGYWDGIHGINPQPKLAEISAIAEQEKEKAALRYVDKIKNIEAQRDIVAALLAEANRLFALCQSLTKGKVPGFVLPALSFVGSILTTAAETFFLAPLLAGLGIPRKSEQIIIAFAFVFTVGVLLKTAVIFWQKEKKNWWGIGALLAFDVIFAGAIGLWRYYQMSFMGEANPALNRFLTETSTLSPFVLTLLTVFLGMASTLALNYGVENLGLWFNFNRARARKNKLQKQFERYDKKLAALKEKLEREQNSIEQKAEEFKQSYLGAYQNGRQNKPLQEDWRLIALKIGGISLSVLALVFISAYSVFDGVFAKSVPSDFGRFLLYGLTAISISAVSAYFVVKSWQRPNKKTVYEEMTIDWAKLRQPESRDNEEEITVVNPKFNGQPISNN
jgi:hypothetical protein